MTSTLEALLAPDLSLPPRYQVRAILKETPSTCVYRVFDVSDQRDEAIKILRHEVSEPQQPRVQRERELRKYVGDYTLFMSGVFRSYIEKKGGTPDHPNVRWEEFGKLLASPRLPSGLKLKK